MENMQTASKYIIANSILNTLAVGLVLSAIIMELLPEEEAKVFVIPTLVAALFAVSSTLVFRKFIS